MSTGESVRPSPVGRTCSLAAAVLLDVRVWRECRMSRAGRTCSLAADVLLDASGGSVECCSLDARMWRECRMSLAGRESVAGV